MNCLVVWFGDRCVASASEHTIRISFAIAVNTCHEHRLRCERSDCSRIESHRVVNREWRWRTRTGVEELSPAAIAPLRSSPLLSAPVAIVVSPSALESVERFVFHTSRSPAAPRLFECNWCADSPSWAHPFAPRSSPAANDRVDSLTILLWEWSCMYILIQLNYYRRSIISDGRVQSHSHEPVHNESCERGSVGRDWRLCLQTDWCHVRYTIVLLLPVCLDCTALYLYCTVVY